MANRDEIQKSIYKAVYRVIKTAKLPTIENFLVMPVQKLGLKTNSPSDWSSFWAEELTAQINNVVQSDCKRYIADFDYTWFNDENKTMSDIREFIYQNQREILK
jgi:hypothetical protein